MGTQFFTSETGQGLCEAISVAALRLKAPVADMTVVFSFRGFGALVLFSSSTAVTQRIEYFEADDDLGLRKSIYEHLDRHRCVMTHVHPLVVGGLSCAFVLLEPATMPDSN